MERTSTVGRVVAAGCVAKERLKTVGRVVVAGGVANERINRGRVVLPVVLLNERSNTGGRVVAAGCVAMSASTVAVLKRRLCC